MQNLLLSTVAFLLVPAVSAATPNFYSHTHTYTPIELKSISHSSDFTKLASVCFLGFGNCGENQTFTKGDDYAIDTVKQCNNEGFTITSCSLPEYPFNQCPYNQNYYASCKEDKARACQEAGYVSSCGAGYVQDSSQVCPYNSSYFKCKCNPCDGYPYTYAQATAQGYVTDGSCQSCSTTKYKRKNNSCNGYNSCECGGQIGTSTCYSGTAIKYQVCKSCCENECTLPSCPAGYTCRNEACSNKYCKTGCAVNYTDWCTQPVTDCGVLGYTKTVDQCPDGYLKCPYGETVFCPNELKCAIGDIYYTDKTCAGSADYNSSKTALGVVVYVTDGGRHGQVMTASPLGSTYQWGGYNYDVPVNQTTDWTVAQKDYDSCGNTDKLLGDSQSHPAAQAARGYSPTPETKGKWCLPAAGVISSWYVNRSTIDVAIAKLGGTQLGLTDPHTWSSSEYSTYNAWLQCTSLGASHGGLSYDGKGNGTYVRPVLEF